MLGHKKECAHQAAGIFLSVPINMCWPKCLISSVLNTSAGHTPYPPLQIEKKKVSEGVEEGSHLGMGPLIERQAMGQQSP